MRREKLSNYTRDKKTPPPAFWHTFPASGQEKPLTEAANSDAFISYILVYKMGLVLLRTRSISGLSSYRGVLAVVGEGETQS